MKQQTNGFIRGCVLLFFVTFLTMSLPQDSFAKKIKTEHFVVKYEKGVFSYATARDVANAAETAWGFCSYAGFSMPATKSRIVISLLHKSLVLSSPASVPGKTVTRDHIYLLIEPTDPQEYLRLLTAHEFFHQVIYTSKIKGDLNRWVLEFINASNLSAADKAEFWLFFEGLPETIAWLIFPNLAGGEFSSRAGVTKRNEEADRGKFWFSPTTSQGEGCSFLNSFSEPWNVQPACGTSRNLETQAYYTIPFWLAVAQWTTSTGHLNDNHLYAVALRKVVNRIASNSKKYSLISAIRHGIKEYLNTFQLTRSDIRDLMSLSAGVERFHDDRRTKYRIAHFRDYETSGNDIEDPDTFPSWAVNRFLIAAPTAGNILTFADAPIPALFNALDGQLFEARYNSVFSGIVDNELPAFAGTVQGLGATDPDAFHPIAVNFVPPGAIEFKDRLATDPLIHPVAVAGLRRAGFDDLDLDFPMRFIDITDSGEGVKLALNNFRLRDLSVFRVAGRNSNLKYRYTFLGKHSKPLRVSSSPAAPRNPEPTRLLSLDDGEWFIRGIKPRASQHVSVMLTPADLPTKERRNRPCRTGKSSYGLWCNNQFDIVERREDTDTGEWTTATRRRSTYWAVVKTPAPGTRGARKINTRLDIARFKPGSHGGGSFFITAVDEDLATNPMPDLLVRGIRFDNTPSYKIGTTFNFNYKRLRPDKGCQVLRTIKVYVTNQGTQNARHVQVSLRGVASITNPNGETFENNFHQKQKIPNGINPGETKVVDFVVGGDMPFDSRAGVSAKIILDPKDKVAEAMEANNVYAPFPIDFVCNGPRDADIDFPDFGDILILDELPADPTDPSRGVE